MILIQHTFTATSLRGEAGMIAFHGRARMFLNKLASWPRNRARRGSM